MRRALKGTTQRYKSLAGFAIYVVGIATTCDISSMRYAPSGREADFVREDLYHIATDRSFVQLTGRLYRI